MEYENALERAYADFFACGNCNSCSEELQGKKCKFCKDHAAKVGARYGEKGPKVLVVGKESVNFHETFEKPVSSLDDAHNEHYRKTLYTLALILDKGKKVPKSFAITDLKQYEKLLERFSLTNYYKCALEGANADSVQNLPTTQRMKSTCYQLLLKEIDVLQPDLVVIQGKFTTKEFWEKLDEKDPEGNRVWGNKEKDTDTISLYSYFRNGKTFYVLYSYHPSYFKAWSGELFADLQNCISEFKKIDT